MPSGDAQRAWFPEMLSELERFWVDEPDWRKVITFCEQMTILRSEIRDQRGIRPPMITCRSCGKKHVATVTPISPRSMLYALQKINVIDDKEFKRLDKVWTRYRKAENLDACGHRNVLNRNENTHKSTCHGKK